MRPEDLLARLEAGYAYDPMYGQLCNERDQLKTENAKLRELVVDMLPFAEVGMDDTCVTRRCRLFEQCEDVIGVKCAIEQHVLDRMRELGIEVNG